MPSPGAVCQTPTSRSGSWKGSGFNSTPRTTLKMAVLAPMPSASVSTATEANSGVRRRRRITASESGHREVIRFSGSQVLGFAGSRFAGSIISPCFACSALIAMVALIQNRFRLRPRPHPSPANGGTSSRGRVPARRADRHHVPGRECGRATDRPLSLRGHRHRGGARAAPGRGSEGRASLRAGSTCVFRKCRQREGRRRLRTRRRRVGRDDHGGAPGGLVLRRPDAPPAPSRRSIEFEAVRADAKRPLQAPPVRIVDSPRFEWRGAMLDVARHFFSVDEVKRYIDLIALYKLNRLHLHLADDQGWRIEIKSWPNLATHRRQHRGWRRSRRLLHAGAVRRHRRLRARPVHRRSFPRSTCPATPTRRWRRMPS